MNSPGDGCQRTGQPKWLQLMVKAMKSWSEVRRSQAAVFAVIPAQGSGDASRKSTAEVAPTLKAPTGPTVRQTPGSLRKSGAKMNPISGRVIIPAPTPARAKETFSRNLRRVISSRVGSRHGWEGSGLLSFMENFGDPAAQRNREQAKPSEQDDPRGDDAPENKRCAQGHTRGTIGGARKTPGRKRVPLVAKWRWFVEGHIASVAGLPDPANQRAICAKIALK